MLHRVLVPLLLGAATVLYFVDLGGSSVWDANEAFYVETPREMMERGDFVSPRFNYEPRLNKPVLSYWIVAGFYRLFGVSVGVQRLPIALGALLLIATAFLLARAAAPDGANGPQDAWQAGIWAALGLAVSPRLMMFARRIFIDIYISMFMALTLVCFALAERYPARRRLWMALMYVAVGLGVLTKGPVAALVPGLVFAIYLTVHRELQRARDMMIPLGVLIVLAIVVPWYAALYTREGWGPIFMFFLGENVARYTDGFGVQVDRGFFFYLPVLFTDSFPWSLLLFPAAAAWIADRRRSLAGRDAGFRVRTLLWLWIIVIVAFFSLSAAKQDLYIFPIVPAVSALGGLAIARAFRSPDLAIARHVRLAVIATGACAFVIGAALIYLFTWVNQAHQLQGTALTGIAAVAGGITAVGLALRGRLPGALFTIAAATAALNWVLVLRVLPSFEAYKPVPAFASVLRARLDNDDVVATYDEALPSLVFYLERHVEEVFDRDPLLRLFESDTTAYVVMRENEYERIRADIGVPTCVVQSQPTFDVKLRNVLARDPLPDLVLVTNRCGSRF